MMEEEHLQLAKLWGITCSETGNPRSPECREIRRQMRALRGLDNSSFIDEYQSLTDREKAVKLPGSNSPKGHARNTKKGSTFSINNTKYCNGCQGYLSVTSFAINRSTNTGLDSKCKACRQKAKKASAAKLKSLRMEKFIETL